MAKKKPVIKIVAPPPEAVTPKPLAPSTVSPGNDNIALTSTTTKTFLRPRLTGTRWSGVVDEFGGTFDGEIQLGNGTQFRVGFFFTQQRHFVAAIYGVGSWRFPAGKRTTPREVQDYLCLSNVGDASNLCDFINSQLDGLDETEHVGTYDRRFCS